MNNTFSTRKTQLLERYEALIQRPNRPLDSINGIYRRFEHPVLTAEHIPLTWRYDFNEQTNPYLQERIMMNAVMNSGAIMFDGKYVLVARVEGADRKSFFAVAESPNGVDNFRFWDEPITMPDGINKPATNVYDMRLTKHEDGWIYGVFCVERHDDSQPFNTSAAVAAAGIARTHDLKTWERLPDLKSLCQQRNVVLHPEFVNGKYAFYTRPQDGFIETGKGGGIGWTLVDDITHAEVRNERIINARYYHTIMEVKNGEGPAPIKTKDGWLHLAHGVRNTADGLRYVLYMYMTSLEDPTKIIYEPAGYFLAPQGCEEYCGDVMNVAFSNGWIVDDPHSELVSESFPRYSHPDIPVKDTRRVLIYYATADTRMHVAESTIDRLVDYCKHTQKDGLTTSASVETIKQLIRKNSILFN